jgi:ornithine decarboxylase
MTATLDTDLALTPLLAPSSDERVRAWLARYAPAEAAGLGGALLAAGVADRLGAPVVTAYAGAIGETLAFYLVIVTRDLRRRAARTSIPRTLRDLAIEFAPAELLDTFLVRPAAMYVAPLLFGSVAVGIVVGKVAADVVFYSVAIVSSELLRRRRAPDAIPSASAVTLPLALTALDDRRHPTPCLLIDLDAVTQAYLGLVDALPVDAIHYAVKCNPEPDVLGTLHRLGCRFEVASYPELEQLTGVGVAASDVLFSNPVKHPEHVRLAYESGCWRFAADSAAELLKLARYAPGSAVYVRLRTRRRRASAVPSEGKFGVDARLAADLLRTAASLGLRPYGLTFHVGSQMTRPDAWSSAIAQARAVVDDLASDGIRIEMLNIGGGFPARYSGRHINLADYGRAIERALSHLPYRPTVVAEPGRALVAEAGVLVGTVIGIATRGGSRWVHLDVGAFNGVMEALESRNTLMFPVSDDRGGPAAPCHLTGPTCDSQDTILFDTSLSRDLVEGDRVYIGTAGAYTTAYASRFNGFDIPQVRLVAQPSIQIGVLSATANAASSRA